MARTRTRKPKRWSVSPLRQALGTRLERVGRFVASEVREVVSVPAPRAPSGRPEGATRGAPPRLVSGGLRDSIGHRVDRRRPRVWIGSAFVGRFLEPPSKGHPFMLPTIRRNRRAILRRLMLPKGRRR